MGSRLSSLLVQAGFVELSSLKEALTKRAIDGGALDSVLLERGLVEEAPLTALLSEATGHPPMEPEIMDVISRNAAARLPLPVAQRLLACPVKVDAVGMTMLVADSTSDTALDELAFQLGLAIHPFVGPTLRVEQAIAMAYGSTMSPRLMELIARVGARPPEPVELPLSTLDALTHRRRHTRRPFGPSASALQANLGERFDDTLPGLGEPVLQPVDTALSDEPVAPAPALGEEITIIAELPEEGDTSGGFDPSDHTPAEPTMALGPGSIDATVEMREDRRQGDDPFVAHAGLTEEATLLDARAAWEEEPVAAWDKYEESDTPVEDYAPRVLTGKVPDGMPPVPDDADDADDTEQLAAGDAESRAVVAARESAVEEPACGAAGAPAFASADTHVDVEAAAEHPADASPAAEDETPRTGVPSAETRGVPVAPAAAQVDSRPASAALTATALSVDEAVALMSQASDRGGLLLALARGSASELPSLQIYVRERGDFVGYLAWSDGVIDRARISGHVLTTAVPSVISRAAEAGSIYVGPVPDTDESPRLLASCGLVLPRRVVVCPVVLRRKTIAMVVAGVDLQRTAHLRKPLTHLAEAAALALAELIVRKKAAHSGAHPALAEPASVPAPKPVAPAPPPAPAPPAVPKPPAVAPAPPEETFEGRIRTLLETLRHSSERERARATVELRELGKPALQLLLRWFPGRLMFPGGYHATPLPAAVEGSEVMRGLLAIGRGAIPELAPLLRAADPTLRLHATFVLHGFVFPETVTLLGKRTADSDRVVRSVAVRALDQFRRSAGYDEVLRALEGDLDNPDPRPRRGAAEALAALGEERAVPSLAQLLDDGDEGVRTATLAALTHMTKQDFGYDLARWGEWWEKNHERSRWEWLIDGLVSEDVRMRQSSAAELELLSGEPLAYDPDLPPRAREEVRRQALRWLQEKLDRKP